MNRAAVLIGVLLIVLTAVGMGAVGMSLMPSSAIARFDPSGLWATSYVAWQWHPVPPWTPFPRPVQQDVRMLMMEFAFEPSVVLAAPGVPINLELVNTGAVAHTLVIPTLGTRAVVEPGQYRFARLGPVEEGVYEFFCAMPAHREAGMIGRLIVGARAVARDHRGAGRHVTQPAEPLPGEVVR